MSITVQAPTTTPLKALARVNEVVDLANVRRKLADSEEGKGHDATTLDSMEAEYRRYLALKLAFPDADIVPCKIVDEMWHQHILDTMAYATDCEALFGYFLHHYPYFGMRDEAEAQQLVDAYADTIERYIAAFGEPPSDTWTSADSSRCRTACKPQRCK
jgi:hypothetical protein